MYKIPEKTVLIGKKIISLPACESTNTVLVSQADRLEAGTVLITENQTKGRGQAGNSWLTEAGANLTFSVLLKPAFLEPSQQFYLNMAVGMAVADAIAAVSGLNPLVKWPNDVLVLDKKICGILIENQIHGIRFSQSVVGIGLNVNQKEFDWPRATSLCLSAGRYFNRTEVLEKLLEMLDRRYNQLSTNQWTSLSRDYHEKLYRRGEEHEFLEANGETFSGRIEGVDEVGRLIMATKTGIRKFSFKEVAFVM
jgi:BirA family biotin operon repressor/biotin-[acetyl-CoA-carboxylase] ligase